MSNGEFRFSYFSPRYEETLAFYRDGLGLPVLESWDRAPDDRGTLFSAASGVIEVLARPEGAEPAHLWDRRPPQGAFMVIEVDDVDAQYRRALGRGLSDQARARGSGVGPPRLLPPGTKRPRRCTCSARSPGAASDPRGAWRRAIIDAEETLMSSGQKDAPELEGAVLASDLVVSAARRGGQPHPHQESLGHGHGLRVRRRARD